MRPQMWPLAKIKPHPDNPRTHPPAEIALLAQMILDQGADQPIVVRQEDGFIIKGHGRLEAAALAKLDAFPVVVRSVPSDAEAMAQRIQDNAVPLLAGWNRELVFGAISSLRQVGYDVGRLGFGETQLVQFETLPGPPAQFPAVGSDLKTDFTCPRCSYSWSGEAKPKPAAEKKKTKRKARR
jgi:hypothetical protein